MNSIKHERKLKNLLAHMIGELYFPEYQASTYDEADIPTREVVDRYLPKIAKIFSVEPEANSSAS